MNKVIICALVILCLGCDRVVFDTPQPGKCRTLSVVPKLYEGVYANDLIDIEVRKDSVCINKVPFEVTTSTPIQGQMQIRFYSDNFFFVNIPDSIGYSVTMVQFFEKSLALYSLSPDSRTISFCSEYMSIERLNNNGNSIYIAKPIKRQFDELIINEMFESFAVIPKVKD